MNELITPRELVQAMYETGRADVEGVRQILRQERLVEVPQAVAAKKRRDATIRIYCRVTWVVIVTAAPLGIAREVWPDLLFAWMMAAMVWSTIVVALFFLLTKEEKSDVWTVGGTHG